MQGRNTIPARSASKARQGPWVTLFPTSRSQNPVMNAPMAFDLRCTFTGSPNHEPTNISTETNEKHRERDSDGSTDDERSPTTKFTCRAITHMADQWLHNKSGERTT
ncbi:hypothetical protein ZOSMA_42G00790 [Zostera marina]|uniref:Uncharacterized protein n=1 Tax=Zostera marina TaxID=29655 RepID=A0A0K9P237_ZOSMR|nr:hypothetical protein ZOSMA_42G00790 [Zostera marina]